MNGPPGCAPPSLTEEDAVLEGEGRGALLAAEAAHGDRRRCCTATQPHSPDAEPHKRRKLAPAHRELTLWSPGALPLTRWARLTPCPRPAHPRRRTLPGAPPHAPPPEPPLAGSLGHVAVARCPLEAVTTGPERTLLLSRCTRGAHL